LKNSLIYIAVLWVSVFCLVAGRFLILCRTLCGTILHKPEMSAEITKNIYIDMKT